MRNAGVQPVVPHIEQHVSLPLFNLEAEQSHDCPAHTLRHLFSSEAHDLNRSQRYPSPTTTTTTARGFTHCLLTLLNLPSPLVFADLDSLDLLRKNRKMALKFAPFGSEIELPFYDNLSQSKIDHDKLDDSARRVMGLYEPRVTLAPDESCKMMVLGNALTSEE
jgi:hypothetical protein